MAKRQNKCKELSKHSVVRMVGTTTIKNQLCHRRPSEIVYQCDDGWKPFIRQNKNRVSIALCVWGELTGWIIFVNVIFTYNLLTDC